MKKLKHIIYILFFGNMGFYAQTTDSLHHYLEIAAGNNPGVKSDLLVYKASLEKIPQAGAWENPTLDIGVYLEPMEVIGGKQIAEFTVMQMFPWFGTKKAAQEESSHMANTNFEKFRESKATLYSEVSNQWFLLCELQQKLINSRENKNLLTKLEDLASRRFSSSGIGGASGSSSSMSEVLRIQLEAVEMDNTIESVLSEIQSEKAKFNILLNRAGNSNLLIPDTLEQIEFIFDEEVIMSKIREHSPTLNMITEEGLAYKAKAEMDKKMSYPMFGLGLQYMVLGKANSSPDPMAGMASSTSGGGHSDGMDMIMPMVSITLPIHRKKFKAQQAESKIWWQSSQERYNYTLNQIETELYKTKHLLNDASRKIEMYNKQIKLATTTYNLVVKEFVTGKSNLANVLEVQRQLLDYKLKKTEAIVGYNTEVASIQKMILSENKTQR